MCIRFLRLIDVFLCLWYFLWTTLDLRHVFALQYGLIKLQTNCRDMKFHIMQSSHFDSSQYTIFLTCQKTLRKSYPLHHVSIWIHLKKLRLGWQSIKKLIFGPPIVKIFKLSEIGYFLSAPPIEVGLWSAYIIPHGPQPVFCRGINEGLWVGEQLVHISKLRILVRPHVKEEHPCPNKRS